MDAALSGGAFTVNGDGLQARDFPFIDNVVHANLLALKAPTLPGRAVNVACGEKYTLLDLIDAIADAAGIAPVVVYGDRRPGRLDAI